MAFSEDTAKTSLSLTEEISVNDGAEDIAVETTQTSQKSKQVPLSRKAQKRFENFLRVREAHKLKRRARKEERRKRKVEQSFQVDSKPVDTGSDTIRDKPTKKELNQQIKDRMRAAMNGPGPRVCIDMSMAHTMNSKEIHKLAGQIGRLYGSNRKAEKPLHMYLSSLDKMGPIYQSCVKRNDGFDNYLIDMSEDSHTDLFKTEEIIYLTPDSPNVLEHLEEDKVYIVGGLVDETPNKFYTLSNAKEHGHKTACFPIDEYMKKSASGTYSKILTVNQVFDILLTLHNTGDWKQALVAGVPPRKGYILR